MQSTFENTARLHMRHLEREKHMNIMESINDNDGTFLPPFKDTDDTSPAVDALAGLPLAHPPPGERNAFDRPRGRFRWCRNNKYAILGTVIAIVVILVAFAVGFDVGEEEEAQQMQDIDDEKVADLPPWREDKGLERYNDLFSQILDWNITPRTVLENVASAPGRALNWLAYEDILTINSQLAGSNVETIRTRYALATLYFSTQTPSFVSDSIGSSSWKQKINWLSSFPVCQWYGVTCLNSASGGQLGLVSELNLTSNGLAGKLPNEVGLLLLDIHTLDLSGNSINGMIPESFQMLENLKYIYLGPNNFTSSIPEAIFGLSHLVHLYLHDCQLEGEISSEIGKLLKLQELGLNGNFLRGRIPDSIGNLSDLTSLYLDGNSLTSSIPSTIGELSSLGDLRLNDNMLTGKIPTDFEQLSVLQGLYLSTNELSGSLSASLFASNRFLSDVQVHNCRFNGSLPTEIGSLVYLRHFYADGNSITGHVPSSIGILGNLETLFLNSNQLGFFLPREIGKMSSLKMLKLEDNQLSGPLPDFGALPMLEILHLNNNTLGGGLATAGIDSLPNLKSLKIHGNHITGTMPEIVCTFPNLTDVSADCLSGPNGLNPEVTCDCCTACYHD